jgi:hypothetical protein
MVLVIAVTLAILNVIPDVQKESRINALQARAVDLSKIILEDPGYPFMWDESAPERIGFSEYNNYSNMTVLGELDEVKIDNATINYSYSFLRNSLGISNDSALNFRLLIEIENGIDSDFYEYPPPNSSNVVSLKRFATTNGSLTNITLVVWQ